MSWASRRARIYDATTVGVDPVIMLTGPIPATRTLLERNGMTISDLDLIEVNEAFASVLGAWRHELQPDMDRVNVNGGGLALGHPLGSSGARLIATLLHELERSDGELGLVTMCTAGGTGTATLIQRICAAAVIDLIKPTELIAPPAIRFAYAGVGLSVRRWLMASRAGRGPPGRSVPARCGR